VACDAGGTMTDVIVVDETGRCVIGKAPTTPHDESIGFMESLHEALGDLGLDLARGRRRFRRTSRPRSTPEPRC
jgi:N-methylhydantoinase A/acetone carboxylase beta subunit